MIATWVGISCDDCGLAGEILETAKLARAAARRAGWLTAQPAAPTFAARLTDYCPKCRRKRESRVTA